ncbi:hypothetical protein CHARACLAT_013961 [Characodon lateralis]|uniref:Uncharacterized protein n=1 Tax=Characodon lateralis TaxID=208331 RepID=A0ABU7EIY2_9TELE|nr:hypothetical protein [Characodon lateralis]
MILMGHRGRGWTALVWLAAVCLVLTDGRRSRQPRCPVGCTCTKDNALCENVRNVPHAFPSDVVSLSFVKSGFNEITGASFVHTPNLQLLLFTANSLDLIDEDAFVGLPHLEYLFIENNRIASISPFAFRGLKALLHLVTGSWCLSPAAYGHKAGYTVDRLPVHHRTAQRHTGQTTMPIQLHAERPPPRS